MPITLEQVENLRFCEIRSPGGRRRFINVLGAGGIGSNMTRLACRLYNDVAVNLFDFDTLEFHNLNRTSMFPVAESLSGNRAKVHVLARSTALLARECAPDGINNEAISRAVHSSSLMTVTEDSNLPSGALTIDARDSLDPTKITPNTWIKLSYDGGSSIAFTFRPKIVANRVIDIAGRSSYEVTPSFYVPAAFLCTMGLRFSQFFNLLNITDMRAGTFECDIDDFMNNASFDWTPEGEE